MTKPPPKSRYKPRQSRSLQTSIALQDAFVRLLRERNYGRVSIREIVELAGVGLGTFYEHYANREELVRACLHFRTQRILTAFQTCRAGLHGQTLEKVIETLLDSVVALHEPKPERWSVYYLLQRQYTDQPTYRQVYTAFVNQWALAMEAATDWPTGKSAQESATVVMTLLYGLVTYTFLGGAGPIRLATLRRQLREVIFGYLGRMSVL